MKTPLRVLIVEDSEFDAKILVNVLKKGGYDPVYERVETSEAMAAALKTKSWDIILSDYNMPEFSAPDALKLLQETGLDLPFIIVSGGIGEDTAVAAMKAGAHDYLMKGNLARLAPAVERELREAVSRAARRQAEEAERQSEIRYRLLWETATDGVVLMDKEGVIHFANPAVETIFGYPPAEVIGKPLEFLQSESLRGSASHGIQEYLGSVRRNVKAAPLESIGLNKSGKELPIELVFSDMEWHGTRWFVGFIRDISERKKAEEELRENEEQFRVAREIQQRLFPKAPPAVPGLDIDGASYPAEATGGDYFDYLPMLNGGWGIVVGDVTGHGVGPALLMAETRAYLRLLTQNREDVGEILTRANQALAEDVGYERFVTLLFARLDADTRTLNFASAGHPPAYVLSQNGEIRARLCRTNIPLGIKPDTVYHSNSSIVLQPGEIVLFLTDGMEETMAPDNTLFGIERAVTIVHENRDKTSREIVEILYQAIKTFAADTPQMDDFTAVIMKVL